jgi:hypothetical protein
MHADARDYLIFPANGMDLTDEQIGSVTSYYISCRLCKNEIEVHRRWRGKKIAFGAEWSMDIVCHACGTKAFYGYDDVRKRHEPSAEPLEEVFFKAYDRRGIDGRELASATFLRSRASLCRKRGYTLGVK